MPSWLKVIGTQTGRWMLGLGGILLKNSSSANTLDVRNNQDTDFADVKIKKLALNTSISSLTLQQSNLQNTNYAITFPNTPGTTGQVLSTDGAGNLGWINGSSSSPYNQSLNTSDSVTFVGVTAQSLTATGVGTPTFTSGNDIIFDPVGVINVSAKKITNLATPTSATDAANKNYVDSRTLENLADVATTPVAGDVLFYTGSTWTNFSPYKIGHMALPAITCLTVSNVGSTAYAFSSYAGTNPTVYAISGTTIAFDLRQLNGSHPFKIQTSAGVDYNTGLVHIDNNGTVSTDSAAQARATGVLYWQVPADLSGSYRYICSLHSSMTGTIEIKSIAAI